jgi:deazaflavin-dependent oxidoreductase (nitroreductase family)
MAKKYEVTGAINRLTSVLARLGVGRIQLMTTIGRKSGEARRVPVSPIVLDGVEYLVSPYGERAWVQNARANPMVTLRHGPKQRQVRLEEVSDGAAVVAGYYARESFSRPYMEVPENPTVDDFAARSDQFPVFRVTPAG